MPVEMDMNYPSHAVDAILDHRYNGVDNNATFGRYDPSQARAPRATKYGAPRQLNARGGRLNTDSGSDGSATQVMLQHRYGGCSYGG